MSLESARSRVRRSTPELAQRACTLRKEATPAEQVLWEALRDRRCGELKFRRQHAVGTVILDFWCPELRLAIEVDGSIHDDPRVAERDQERQLAIQRYGVRFLRFSNEAVLHDLQAVLEEIRALIALNP